MSEEAATNAEHDVAVEKAKQLHWVPKEEYTGDPAKWRDAEEFLEFGERVLPIVQENNKRLIADNAALKREIAEIRDKVAKFAKVHEQTEQMAYAKAIADLRVERKEALENGDYDRAEEVTEKIETTKAASVQEKQVEQQVATEAPAVVQKIYDEWAKENQWAVEGSDTYDLDMEAYARGIGDAMVKKQNISATGEDFRPFLDKIAKKVKERFPEKFGNPARKAAASVEGDGGAGDSAPASKKTYTNLPKEAKESCDFLIATGTFANRDEYLKKYNW